MPLGTIPRLDSWAATFHQVTPSWVSSSTLRELHLPSSPLSLSVPSRQRNPGRLLGILRCCEWNPKEILRAAISSCTEQFWRVLEALTSTLDFLCRLWLPPFLTLASLCTFWSPAGHRGNPVIPALHRSHPGLPADHRGSPAPNRSCPCLEAACSRLQLPSLL